MNFKSCAGILMHEKKQGAFHQTLLIMRLTGLLIIIFCFNVTASVLAQQINLNIKEQPIEKVFDEISKQSGFQFVYNDRLLEHTNNVSLALKNATLQTALDECFKNQPVTYKIVGKSIVVKLKVQPQKNTSNPTSNITIKGIVTDTVGHPLPGAVIKIKGTNIATIAKADGSYEIKDVPDNAILIISIIGYQTEEIPVSDVADSYLKISLKVSVSALSQVSIVSTGYQQIPKERATGSFDQIDKTLLNRRVSTNILDRIDGIAPGVYTNGLANITSIATDPSGRNTGITIRGKSTYNSSTEPLIVVDNFPYEGEISNINPNDVESITILKDAAAASIWGTRSGNGVIVITTKKGRLNQKMKVDFNSNATVTNKPNLFYSKNFLDSKSYIGVEQYLFNQGYFDPILSDNVYNPAVSPAVDIMAQQRAGAVSASQATNTLNDLASHDVRNDYYKYVYQKAINQQYSLGISGGSNNMTYQLSVGDDNNKNSLVRNGFQRTTVNSTNTYAPIKNLEITAGINYSQSTTTLNNNQSFGSFSGNGYPYGNIYPYARLADGDGNALALPYGLSNSYLAQTKSEGFLDWQYRPLDEINLGDNNTKVSDLVLKLGARYKIIEGFNFQINYQKERQTITERNYQSQQTYYTRNLINQFSAYDPNNGVITYNFPLGGILNVNNSNWNVDNLRTQFNFDRSFGNSSITAIAGAELKQFKTETYLNTSYGYNDELGSTVSNLNYADYFNTNPAGSALIPSPNGPVLGTLNRYVSYYANAAYAYGNKYTLTLSGREDGTNLFGAKTNDKITPLWSAGLGWDISKETFFKTNWMTFLKLRATYGFNGNIYQNGSAYLIGYAASDPSTGAPIINKPTAPNPELRWEKVKNINIGIDFGTKNNIITGTIELYQKNGQDLIQATSLAPQTGFTTYQANTANSQTKGFDLNLQSQNFKGVFKWRTNVFISAFKDKVVKFDAVRTRNSIGSPGGVVDKPLEGLFSYKWAGLDPTNGDPQGYLNGHVSKDYTSIINNFNADSLIYSGSLVPTVYGSFRNDFAYQNFSLSVNITYQLGFVFRRTTTDLNYTNVLLYGQNEDYNRRWQKPGDELHTSIPSLTYPDNSDRNTFYHNSQTLVESGDNIRLQDVRLGYDLPASFRRKIHASRLNIYAYANNLGIIWRKNKLGIDPSAIGNGLASYPNPFSISLGLNINY